MIRKSYNKVFNKLSDYLSLIAGGKVNISGRQHRSKFKSIDKLVAQHFTVYSDEDHPCRSTLACALNMLNKNPATIIETGSSAWGTNSTLLLDSYVNSFGGSLESVDIRLQPAVSLRGKCSRNTKLHCDDSVSFLNKWSLKNFSVDLVYLDSWDVDWENPIPSAIHGLNEFLSIFSCLKEGSILLVDDTPVDLKVMSEVQPEFVNSFQHFKKEYHFYPGKGSLIKQFLISTGQGNQIAHKYQLLWQF